MRKRGNPGSKLYRFEGRLIPVRGWYIARATDEGFNDGVSGRDDRYTHVVACTDGRVRSLRQAHSAAPPRRLDYEYPPGWGDSQALEGLKRLAREHELLNSSG
jgi:hypothetical protein